MPTRAPKRKLKQYFKHERDKSFYDSAAWKRLREARLLMDNYLCVECNKQGKVTPAQQVHHIDDNRSYQLVPLDELESLCNSCHRIKGTTT